MEAEFLHKLDLIIELGVWACRLLSVAIGVLLFRFVTLRSSL